MITNDTAPGDTGGVSASSDAATERVFVAVGVYGWGKGPSATVAKDQCAKALGLRALRRRDRVVVKLLPPGAHNVYVDNFGTILWEGGDGSAVVTVEDRSDPTRKR